MDGSDSIHTFVLNVAHVHVAEVVRKLLDERGAHERVVCDEQSLAFDL